ncbi:MAG: SDR family oxidoreductase [Acetobacteraceae bacterium]|nr:SDR family oxidoreductase [Acetobacteraceae bacterium]
MRATFVLQHRPPSIALLFGDARPDPRFLAQLHAAEPAFRAAYDAWLDAAIAPDEARIGGLPVLPPASACIGYQFAVAALWRAWGIKPVVVGGEGAGEVAAALVAGGLTLQGAAAVARRLDGTARPAALPVDGRLAMKLILGSRAQMLDAGQALSAQMLDTLGGVSAGQPARARLTEAADLVIACGSQTYGALLQDLATGYLAGAAVDWRRLHEGDGQDPAPLPNYAFQRSRFWPQALSKAAPAPAEPPRAPEQDGLFAIEWQPSERQIGAPVAAPAEVMAGLRSRVMELQSGGDFDDVRDVQRELNRFAAFSICEALRQLKPDIGPGTVLPADDVGAALGVVAGQRRLAARMMGCLESCGLVERQENRLVFTGPLLRASLPGEIASIRASYPRFETEIRIAAQAERLADVLRGHATGVDVLFPNGSPALVDALYRDSVAATVMNRLTGEAIGDVARSASGRRLRILEIGGGTGSTTEAVLPRLSENIEYAFTDVSPAFLPRARAAFGSRVARYEVLDIESDADVRAFAQAPFDVILAANVLHATRSIRATLQNVGSLLRPGGALVLLEGIETQPIADVTLGMLEGWWLHEDASERSSGPLLSRAQWVRVLTESGFEAETLPAEPSLGGITAQQTVVVARRRAVAKAVSAVTILHRGAAAAPAVRAALEAAGLRVEEAAPARAPQMLAALESDAFSRRDAAWIYLPGTGAPCARPTEDAREAAADLLGLAECLAGAGNSAPPLWIVTSGAQPVHGTLRPGDAALCGIARVMRSEMPHLRVSVLDLDSETPDWRALAALIAAGRDEPELAVANGRVLVPALAPVQLAPVSAETNVSPDASYLVTGAFGVLGAHAVRWLAEQGAGKLFLVGRNQPEEAALRAIAAARFAGTEIVTVIADVADASDIESLFAQIGADRRPLRGILHAAAALDDAPIARQTAASFARAFAPKAEGAWLLHEHSRRHALDFFVLYSSMAAVIGSAGQSNYAAANCFLDALAHHRQALGLPALSVNWGLWANTGAAVRRDVVEAGTLQGAKPITPEQGHAVLKAAIAAGRAQIAVFPVDRSVLRRSLGGRAVPSLLAPLLADTHASAEAGPPAAKTLFNSFVALMNEAAASERSGLIMRFVRKRLPELLNLDPTTGIEDDRPLLELGLDSLVGLELKNEMQALSGLKLPSTLFFDCPTTGDLARYIDIALPVVRADEAAQEARERVLI